MSAYYRPIKKDRKKKEGKAAFIKGVGRILDTSGSMKIQYYLDDSDDLVDFKATLQDWSAISSDMVAAVKHTRTVRNGREKNK